MSHMPLEQVNVPCQPIVLIINIDTSTITRSLQPQGCLEDLRYIFQTKAHKYFIFKILLKVNIHNVCSLDRDDKQKISYHTLNSLELPFTCFYLRSINTYKYFLQDIAASIPSNLRYFKKIFTSTMIIKLPTCNFQS